MQHALLASQMGMPHAESQIVENTSQDLSADPFGDWVPPGQRKTSPDPLAFQRPPDVPSQTSESPNHFAMKFFSLFRQSDQDLQSHCQLSFGLHPHYPWTPLIAAQDACLCGSQGEYPCPVHLNQAALKMLGPSGVHLGLVDPETWKIVRPLYLVYQLTGFPKRPTQIDQFLRHQLALAFRESCLKTQKRLQVDWLFVVSGEDPQQPNDVVLLIMIKPLIGLNHSYPLIADSFNLVGLAIWDLVSSYYQIPNLKISGSMLPQTYGCQGPTVRFPWYVDLNKTHKNESALFRSTLCTLKDVLADKKLKQRQASGISDTFLQQIRNFTSLTQLEQYITHRLKSYRPVWLPSNDGWAGHTVRFSMLDQGYQCVFAYATCLQAHLLSPDSESAKQIDRFMDSWLSPGFCANLMLTRYNFPVTLYFPHLFREGFEQIKDQLTMARALPTQSRSVLEFVDSIKGDLFSQIVQSFRNHISEQTRLKYYERRTVTAKLNATRKVIGHYNDSNMLIPDSLLDQCKQCEDKLENRGTLEVDESSLKCLRSVFDLKLVPLVTQVCSDSLNTTLVSYDMQMNDPKLTWNMLFRNFVYYVQEQRLLRSGRISLFDTLWLSPEAEMSFLLTAMYISKHLLKRPGQDELVRDYANLLLFGQSGTGKTYTLEALSLLLKACQVSSPTVHSMFSGKPCFGERAMGVSSCLVAQEVQIRSFLQADAKEYLDVSLHERKVNVKFAQPVQISQGVPFMMATNDFFSDVPLLWNTKKPEYAYSVSSEIDDRDQLSDAAVPVMKRITVVPYFDEEGSWLPDRAYVKDFALIGHEVPPLDHHLPYVLSLIGAALMLHGRVRDYLQTPEDVKAYAEFQIHFERTYIGMRIKHMSEKQFQSLQSIYSSYCTLTKITASVYFEKKLFQQHFKRTAANWLNSSLSFAQVKEEFTSEYKRLYAKFVKEDKGGRVFHVGYSQRSFSAVLLKAYSIAIFKMTRCCRKNQLVTSYDYVETLRQMDEVAKSLPKEIVLNTNIEGKRAYRTVPDKDRMYDAYDKRLSLPIMEFFLNGQDEKVDMVIRDYQTDSSDDDRDDLVALQKRRFMNTLYVPRTNQEFRPTPLQPCDSRVVPSGKAMIGVAENKRSRRLHTINNSSMIRPRFFYNSDDQSGVNDKILKKVEERSPLIERAVPFCKHCKLIKQSVKQSYKILTTAGQRRQMNRPLPRRSGRAEDQMLD